MRHDFYVYALLDPRRPGRMEFWPCSFLEEPFYVGKGQKSRAKRHMYEAHSRRRMPQIDELRTAGLKPSVVILSDHLSEDQAFADERYFIAQIGRADRKQGPLLNRTDGGQGMSGHAKSQPARDAVSKAHKGKPKGHGAKISATKRANPRPNPYKGMPRSQETIEKMRAAQKGKPRPGSRGRTVSQDTRDKISAAHKGKILSAETIRKISETKALRRTPEQQERREARLMAAVGRDERRAARIARRAIEAALTPEDREALRTRTQFKPGHNKGIPLSPEVRAKLLAAVRHPDHGAKISAGKRGKPNLKLRGRPRPPEVIAKMKATKALRRKQAS